MAKFPELRWLNRFDWVPVVALALLLQVAWGWHALLWGFFVSSTLLWHGTFTINSLSHVFGSRRYKTGDASRNNALLAIVTMGEGWHNNHHHYMNSANQGFFWWEIDMSYILLRILAVFGIVWDLRKPPGHILAGVSKKVNRPAGSALEGPSNVFCEQPQELPLAIPVHTPIKTSLCERTDNPPHNW